MNHLKKIRAGGWLPSQTEHIDAWIVELKMEVYKQNKPLIKPIKDFKQMVENDSVLNATAAAMFTEARIWREKTPLGTSEVKDFNEFLILLNGIMTQAPQFTVCKDKKGDLEPCGLIGFPINALLDWPMATSFGYDFFANSLVNQQFKKILEYWSKYLVSKDSRYVLVDNYPKKTPEVIAWLSAPAKKEMVKVACEAIKEKDQKNCNEKKFEDIFECDPEDKYYGFKSWDDFFTRKFKEGVRPIAKGEDIIVNACESAPLQVVKDVKKDAKFWLKGQPYSLENMMNFDPLAKEFEGGTVYQAFLSALSYHRWNSPVGGKIKKAFIVNGTYYLENKYYGFVNKQEADPSAPNDSQPFLSAVATRAVIFIEADNPKIGLMCFIAIGMAEVSSCEITVKEGQKIKKGDELGMFHFGGSTHCLIFRPEVKLKFDFHNNKKPNINAVNIPVHAKLATLI
ncbi:phosphatidylserine decarboxylase family protein [Halarcobacter ebronensis]|uniref:Phosphatidylserine decarboxylase n=1 Tax=Halarcobacter ebronensis TaxID=1462615 RepID=A0A4Q1ANK2_9BACT|nr:phosphatidylserine decarboxylase family protein [Halarcobacter ebronensis]QKF83358.1 phosphatidylserine decarboxylase family protein [Halarcobacter ebronensis]RXK05919.1 phosphatidylserine decarboxylase [Halarcobacter ebronensis]